MKPDSNSAEAPTASRTSRPRVPAAVTTKKMLIAMSLVYGVWLVWMAYVAWVNVQAGNP